MSAAHKRPLSKMIDYCYEKHKPILESVYNIYVLKPIPTCPYRQFVVNYLKAIYASGKQLSSLDSLKDMSRRESTLQICNWQLSTFYLHNMGDLTKTTSNAMVCVNHSLLMFCETMLLKGRDTRISISYKYFCHLTYINNFN